MIKREILSSLEGEERILVSRVMDICERCEKTGRVMYTPFMNPREVSLVSGYCKGRFHSEQSGGYADSERRMLAFCPDGTSADDFPIEALKISVKDGRVHSHRDYLGALLSLGLKREKLGDIILCDGYVIVMCDKTVSEFICLHLDRVASSYVQCEAVGNPDNVNVQREYEAKEVSVASMRIDCVVSAVTGKSREGSALVISRGFVQQNYQTVTSVSAQVKNGDVVSVRGYGKMLIETDGITTRKGRLKLNIKHYK